MANEIAKWEPSSKIGPKMAALPTDRHRLFVESLFVCKPGAGNMVAAARRAGWGKPDGSSIPIVMTNIASRLMRDPRVASRWMAR